MTYPTQEQHAQAVLAFLTAAGAHPYDLDDLSSHLPDFYTEITVSRRFGGEVMLGALPGVRLVRITTRFVAKTVSNARNLEAATSAIEGSRLTVAGYTSTPVQFETSEPIGKDVEGYWTGLSAWTYVV